MAKKQTKPAYCSDAAAAVHEMAVGLFKTGAIDAERMAMYDASCLVPEKEEFTPERIVAIRARFLLTQDAFANALHVNVSTVRQWEQGQKRPTAAAGRLLGLVERKGLHVLY